MRYFRYFRSYSLPVIGVLLAITVSSASVLSLGIGIKYLVDEGLKEQNSNALNISLIVIFTIAIILASASYVRYYLVTKIGEEMVSNLRQRIYDHVLTLSPEYFEVNRKGDLVSRITTDTNLIQIVISSTLSVALRHIMLFIGGIAMLVITSPKLSLYILVIVPIVITPVVILGRKVREYSKKVQGKIGEMTNYIEESLHHIRTIQGYVREEYESLKFSSQMGDTLKASMERVKLRSMLSASVIFLTLAAVGVLLWIGGQNVISKSITAGELSSFIFFSIITAGAVGALSEVVGDVQRAMGALERIRELLITKANIIESPDLVSLPKMAKHHISFKDVTFFYPTNITKLALDKVSFDVAKGDKIALVGPSGAGKSTLFQLMLRFYDVAEGEILINDTNIKNLSLKELRNQFSLVSQDTVIFSGTAWENIKYGNLDAGDDEIIRAAKAAHAIDFISKLSEGFNTYLGEKGVKLSGGERQRIAIARAILRKPKILLLDEATNALDADNEQKVQNALDGLSENTTTFTIAHRLSTVTKADKIILLNQGRIEAIGKHEDLLKTSAIYSHLAALQLG